MFLTVLGVSGKPFWPRFGSSWGGLGAILAILGRLGPAKVQFESQVLERSKTSLRGMLVPSRASAGTQAISSPGGFAPHVRGRPPESGFADTPTARIETKSDDRSESQLDRNEFRKVLV